MIRTLQLERPMIRAILRAKPQLLIVSISLKRGIYEVHDKATVEQNRRHRANGRWDLQTDPDVFAIQVWTVGEWTLGTLPYHAFRAAGYKTQRDFFDPWYERYGWIDLDRAIWCAYFSPVETPRYLHKQSHRGYTSNPALALRHEPEALSAADLEAYSGPARLRDDAIRRERAKAERNPPPWRKTEN